MATSAQLSSGLTAIFGAAPTDAQLAVFQSICDTDGIDAAFASAADSSGASDARNVVSYYQVFYGRQPDVGGLNFWSGELASGAETLNSLADKFAVASEFNEQFGNRTTTEIVFAQYRNVLGREPDFEGLTFWSNQVESGNLSLADLGRFFATSDEAQARFDPFIDQLLVDLGNGESPDSDDTLFEVDVDTGSGGSGPTTGAPIDLAGQTGAVNGSNGADLFTAETGDIVSSSVINGGGGADALTVFNDGQGNAISPRMTGVETVVWTEQTNDRNSVADNNVGGFGGFDGTVEVDVELDAGRISGVTRWEDFDSRADLVIEDARDNNDVDGTFTGDIEIAMVSTDPGNVDYAIYFDQPVNTINQSATVELRVLDQEAANGRGVPGANETGFLTESFLSDFEFTVNGVDVPVTLPEDDGTFGPSTTFEDLRATILQATQAQLDALSIDNAALQGITVDASLAAAVPVGVGSNQFTLPVVLTFNVPAEAVQANNDNITVRGRDTGDGATDTFGAIAAAQQVNEELVRLNIDLDDVGKGSMGGDLLAGAMSTGRQAGDDRTSDSQGIQQFDIEVDRSSQLQTINSTNNSLEVVNIVNGANNGPNNTTTAVDDFESGNDIFGDLVVRGRANPESSVATDSAMPGAVPQHDDFGFNDVRVIDASGMRGSVDLTLDLSDEILEKYLTLDDTSNAGNGDDIAFDYDLGTNDDEFLVNMSSSALVDAGTASREDFNITVNGNNGDDTIVTNVGNADKFIDGQGQDAYRLQATNGEAWYANQANNNAAAIRVNGDSGDDSIWTHAWGDATIDAGDGEDVVYTDNEGTVELQDFFLRNIDRNIDEHEQIDYQVGAVWTFNDDNGDDDNVNDISGSTNTRIGAATPDAGRNAGTSYTTNASVTFYGSTDGDDDDNGYTVTVEILDSVIRADGTISEQQMNQAIKRAVNNDPVLNKVLEAVDGPGQSLAVYSKIDGDFETEDLEIGLFEEVRAPGSNAPTINTFDLDDTAFDTDDDSDQTDFQNFGRDSIAESDNRIIIDADGDADVTVLSTNNDGDGLDDDNFDLNGASNERLIIEEGGNFGTETIFNFGADNDDGDANDGTDFFTFSDIDYRASGFNFGDGAVNLSDDSITILEEDAGNNTAQEVADFFDGAATTGTTEHIVIVYDESDNNSGRVYYVTDTAGSAATAVVRGDIELVGTDWDNLDDGNFI